MKISRTVSFGSFTRQDGSVEAFDEVLIAMNPIIKRYSIKKQDEQ